MKKLIEIILNIITSIIVKVLINFLLAIIALLQWDKAYIYSGIDLNFIWNRELFNVLKKQKQNRLINKEMNRFINACTEEPQLQESWYKIYDGHKVIGKQSLGGLLNEIKDKY